MSILPQTIKIPFVGAEVTLIHATGAATGFVKLIIELPGGVKITLTLEK